MAKKPPAAMDDDEEMEPAAGDAGAADEEDAGDESSDESMGDDTSEQPDVVATIIRNADGTYGLVAGDEAEATGGDEGEEGGAAQPQSFDSVGALLKGVLDTIKTHEASLSGEGGDQENFEAGYAGGSGASPAKPAAGGGMPPGGAM